MTNISRNNQNYRSRNGLTTYLIGDLGFVDVYPTLQNHKQVFESTLDSSNLNSVSES